MLLYMDFLDKEGDSLGTKKSLSMEKKRPTLTTMLGSDYIHSIVTDNKGPIQCFIVII